MLPTAPREQLAEALKAAEEEYREAQKALVLEQPGAPERYARADERYRILQEAATMLSAEKESADA